MEDPPHETLTARLGIPGNRNVIAPVDIQINIRERVGLQSCVVNILSTLSK
jgi:hypothetical protein